MGTTLPPRDPSEHAAFVAAFQRAVAVKVAMKRLEMIFTGERLPPASSPRSVTRPRRLP